jgi:hypothetical protein
VYHTRAVKENGSHTAANAQREPRQIWLRVLCYHQRATRRESHNPRQANIQSVRQSNRAERFFHQPSERLWTKARILAYKLVSVSLAMHRPPRAICKSKAIMLSKIKTLAALRR